jgi:hypothetical protein|uniref:Uncharacterized protein n=1 Tax=Picea glauca TaxID=3330 RepID=A0A117NI41_PICGL|nr:hypothetical protein ABT39_MTgene3844 [Picea glauca]
MLAALFHDPWHTGCKEKFHLGLADWEVRYPTSEWCSSDKFAIRHPAYAPAKALWFPEDP